MEGGAEVNWPPTPPATGSSVWRIAWLNSTDPRRCVPFGRETRGTVLSVESHDVPTIVWAATIRWEEVWGPRVETLSAAHFTPAVGPGIISRHRHSEVQTDTLDRTVTAEDGTQIRLVTWWSGHRRPAAWFAVWQFENEMRYGPMMAWDHEPTDAEVCAEYKRAMAYI